MENIQDNGNLNYYDYEIKIENFEPCIDIEEENQYEIIPPRPQGKKRKMTSLIDRDYYYLNKYERKVSSKKSFNRKKKDSSYNLTDASNGIDCNIIDNDPKLVNLRVDNLILEHDIEEFENLLSDSDSSDYQYERLTIEKLKNNEMLLNEYTGIKSVSVFDWLFNILTKKNPVYYSKWNAAINIRHEEQLLLTLMRLKCNFGFADLSYRFRFSVSTVKSSIIHWLEYLHKVLFLELIKHKQFPCYAEDPIALPKEFEIFSNCRIILGVVKIETEVSHQNVGKEYKNKVLKGLIGISPFGEIIFVSNLYSEKTRLKQIILESCLFDKLSPGDLILSTESLDIDDILPPHVEINNPLFLDSSHYVSNSKVLSKIFVACKGLAHVFRKLKKYAVLDRILISSRSLASTFFQVTAGLVNLENFDSKKIEML